MTSSDADKMNPYNQGGGYNPGYPPGPPNQPGFIGGFQPGQPPYNPGQPAYNPGQHPYNPGQPAYPAPFGGGYQPPPMAPYQPGTGAYGGPQMPITNQPGSQPTPSQDGWMNMPQRVPNCPPGLEYLTSIDQLLVKQKVELLEAFTGFETNNKFTIKNSLGQKVYWAAEENDCCTRNCCGPHRPFDMKIMDIHKNQVLHLYRPLRCDACCFPCCLQAMEVSSPPGSVIGSIEQNWSIFKPSFDLKDQTGTTVLKIEGPFCTFSMCGDVEFEVLTLDGRQVGRISKQWSGLARELFTDADHFGISFPMDLDVKMKAVLIGACFLIDVMFFEKSGNRESDRPGMF